MPRKCNAAREQGSRRNATDCNDIASGFGRSPLEQALASIEAARRVLALVPHADSPLMPHPLVIVAAELTNTERYIRVGMQQEADSNAL